MVYSFFGVSSQDCTLHTADNHVSCAICHWSSLENLPFQYCNYVTDCIECPIGTGNPSNGCKHLICGPIRGNTAAMLSLAPITSLPLVASRSQLLLWLLLANFAMVSVVCPTTHACTHPPMDKHNPCNTVTLLGVTYFDLLSLYEPAPSHPASGPC